MDWQRHGRRVIVVRSVLERGFLSGGVFRTLAFLVHFVSTKQIKSYFSLKYFNRSQAVHNRSIIADYTST